ncbi:MAG: hypothetical protein M1830_008381 [Pleopsidium flavum]|nr:MAG: hypothetical protein M1830_008381 [Pleopsidium flavum]
MKFKLAQSPDSQQSARLIREMSRDSNRSDWMSELSAEGFSKIEATISSTLGINPRLSSHRNQMCDSAENHGPSPSRSPDPSAVDAMMVNLFPDFTQGLLVTDDEHDTTELGRGVEKSSKDFTLTLPRDTGKDGVTSAKTYKIDPQLMSTPPSRPLFAAKKYKKTDGAGVGTVRTDAQLRRALSSQKEKNTPIVPLAKDVDYGSGGSRNGSGEPRRTLSGMHARVSDEDDGSMISDGRPANATLAVRKTRFGRSKDTEASTATSELPYESAPTGAFPGEIAHGSDAGGQRPTETLLSNQLQNNPTQDSFPLSELAPLSDICSGLNRDGSPVLARHGRSRSSRFVSATGSQVGSKGEPGHAGVDDMVVLDIEKDILRSLNFLQDRVASLEHREADGERMMQDLKQENVTLKAGMTEKERRRRADSALGSMDGGSEDGNMMARGQGKWAVQQNRLESTITTIQGNLRTANARASILESTNKLLKQDRDSAVSQLRVAYETSEELKEENEMLQKESHDLKSQLAQLQEFCQMQAQQWAKKEAGLLVKIQKGEVAVKEIREMTRDDRNMRQHDEASQKPHNVSSEKGKSRARSNEENNYARVADRVQNELQKAKADVINGPRPSFGSRPLRSTSELRQNAKSKAMISLERFLDANPDTTKDLYARFLDTNNYDELPQDVFGRSNNRLREVVNEGEPGEEATGSYPDCTQDITLLTLLEVYYPTVFDSSHNLICCDQHDDVSDLRMTLEEERAARKQQGAVNGRMYGEEDTVQSAMSTKAPSLGTAPGLPPKSSTKNLTGRTSIKASGSSEQQNVPGHTTKKTAYVKDSANHQRCQSENSVIIKKGNTRRRQSADEMTSAFILPDITLQKVPLQGPEQPKLSAAAQRVVDNLAQHEGRNCTICQRIIIHGEDHTHSETTKQTVQVPKPIPVSERMPETCPYEDGPTIRPSQPPGIALATVMKGLQDELSHLKMKSAQYQTLYYKHDASLSKRQRKATLKKIETLLDATDNKADQIYALYDVLEGQKGAGQEISQEEVEVTLQSIGIDISAIGSTGDHDAVPKAKAKAPSKSRPEAAQYNDVDSDDDNLPWEGVEDTAEMARGGRDGAVSRRGWAS